MRDEMRKLNSDRNAYPHKNLKVWQKAMTLVVKLYSVTKEFPDSERYGLISQIRRCAVSIPSNIAEGHGRSTKKELIRFLDISKGSIYELDTQIELSRQLGYLTFDNFEFISAQIDETSRLLTGLIKLINNSLDNKNCNSKTQN